jgi:hypothetical protein
MPCTTQSRLAVKSLKDQNRWQLWLAILANVVVFYAVMQWDEIAISGMEVIAKKSAHILPVGLAVLVTTVINGLLSPEAKARIVFMRWKNALPGHRAFTDLAPRDSRIDLDRLKKACGAKLPVDPADQNRTWYGLYKSVEKRPSVEQVQRDFLLTRDYSAFTVFSLLVFGTVALFAVQNSVVSLVYFVGLVAQFFLVRQAAANYGNRFVTTVMAEKAVAAVSRQSSVKSGNP